MNQVVEVVRDVLRNHKLKIVSVFVFAFIFGLLIFPYNDLGALLTEQIYEGSQQRVYLTAEKYDLSLFPLPGLQADSVSIEPGNPPTFAPLKINSLSVRPALSSILAFHFGAVIGAEGLFGGQLSLTASTTSSFFTIPPTGFAIDDLQFTGVALRAILDYLGKSNPALDGMDIKGQAHIESHSINVDLTGKTQPDGDLSLRLQNVALPTQFQLPPGSPISSLSIPQITMSTGKIDIRIKSGKLQIVNGTLGGAKDPVHITVLGEIDMTLGPNGAPQTGAHDLCIEVDLSDAYYKDLSKLMPVDMLDQFKRASAPTGFIGYGVLLSPSATPVPAFNANMQKGDCSRKRGSS